MANLNEIDVLAAINAQQESDHQKIEEKRYDESGAQKEVLFHRELFSIIKDGVEFDESGKASVKEGAEDIVFLTVCSRDLKRANKEGGHFGGDTLLKESVKQTESLLKTSGIEDFDIYHIRSSDFIVTARSHGNSTDTFFNAMDNHYISFSEQAKPGRLTTAGISLKDIVEFYNSCIDIDKAPNENTLALNRKSFTGTTIQLLIFKQEHQKLLDIYTDFMQESVISTNVEENFALYGASNFRAQGISTFEDLKKTADAGKLIFELAYSRAYEGGELPAHIWQVMESGTERYSGKALKYMEKTLTDSVLLEKQALSEETLANREQVRQQFTLEKTVFTSENGSALMALSKYINDLPEQFTSISHIDRTQMEKLGAAVETLYSIVSEDPEQRERWEKIRDGMTDAYITVFEKKSNSPEPASEDWTSQLPLERINRILQTTRTGADRLKLERDFLTGLKNKEVFENDLYELLKIGDADVGLVSLDMGFLQYFNNIGERQLGDLAISKAGYILEKVVNDLRDRGISAEAYRVGGDEFTLLVSGDAKQTEEVFSMIYQNTIEENELTEKPTGLIPFSPNCKPTYVPRMLQFDGNPLHSEEGKQALRQIITMEEGLNPFSENDTEILKKGLNGEKLSDDQNELYLQVLSEIMVR
ncbi:diguanylate cyclase, partial [candidate division WWE3 bacterium]|nr:diguanylate cyclase [candidate division WWE3 bacterium]